MGAEGAQAQKQVQNSVQSFKAKEFSFLTE